MVDVWRETYPNISEFTFHSPVHGSSSRTDFWLGTRDVIGRISDIILLPRRFSDYSPVKLALALLTDHRPSYTWRLKPTNLIEQLFCIEIGEAVHNYFSINRGTVDSIGTLWEAYKAVIRANP